MPKKQKYKVGQSPNERTEGEPKPVIRHQQTRFMDFLTHLKKQEEEVKEKKSAFVHEFRKQLCRIPLEHRMAGGRKKSFILQEEMLAAGG